MTFGWKTCQACLENYATLWRSYVVQFVQEFLFTRQCKPLSLSEFFTQLFVYVLTQLFMPTKKKWEDRSMHVNSYLSKVNSSNPFRISIFRRSVKIQTSTRSFGKFSYKKKKSFVFCFISSVGRMVECCSINLRWKFVNHQENCVLLTFHSLWRRWQLFLSIFYVRVSSWKQRRFVASSNDKTCQVKSF